MTEQKPALVSLDLSPTARNAKSEELKAIADLLKLIKKLEISDIDATFRVSDKGLYYAEMDPPHVCLLEATIPVRMANPEPQLLERDFTVELERFEKIINRALRHSRDSKVEMFIDTDELCITILPPSGIRKYTMRLQEEIKPKTHVPELTLPNKIKIAAPQLLDIIEDIAAVEDVVTIETTDRTITFDSRDHHHKFIDGKAELSFNLNAPPIIEATIGKTALAIYSVDYLLNLLNTIGNTIVTLEYSTKMPMLISWNDSKMVYWLAPRISDEDAKEEETDKEENKAKD